MAIKLVALLETAVAHPFVLNAVAAIPTEAAMVEMARVGPSAVKLRRAGPSMAELNRIGPSAVRLQRKRST